MFKDTTIFDGDAEKINKGIQEINELCHDAEYDIRLCGNLAESEVESSGWLDCISITKNGRDVSLYLTASETLSWIDGFKEAISQ